jgi:hypothetical protein
MLLLAATVRGDDETFRDLPMRQDLLPENLAQYLKLVHPQLAKAVAEGQNLDLSQATQGDPGADESLGELAKQAPPWAKDLFNDLREATKRERDGTATPSDRTGRRPGVGSEGIVPREGEQARAPRSTGRPEPMDDGSEPPRGINNRSRGNRSTIFDRSRPSGERTPRGDGSRGDPAIQEESNSRDGDRSSRNASNDSVQPRGWPFKIPTRPSPDARPAAGPSSRGQAAHSATRNFAAGRRGRDQTDVVAPNAKAV